MAMLIIYKTIKDLNLLNSFQEVFAALVTSDVTQKEGQCQSVHHFGPQWNISATVSWNAMIFKNISLNPWEHFGIANDLNFYPS